MTVTVWYHDAAEVDPDTSWTGLVAGLAKARYQNITGCSVKAVTDLFRYARPDAVIAMGDAPVLSIEQTKMNPSGHNLPQRYSCLLRAAELGVAGVLYHPEYARRTYSDPNPRYTNPRVALAQLRMLDLFPSAPPSLSVYWPTDPATLLPSLDRDAQGNLAAFVEDVLKYAGSSPGMKRMSTFLAATAEMHRVVDSYGSRIKRNRSFRAHFPDGMSHTRTSDGHAVDPPPKAVFERTDGFIDALLGPHATEAAGEAVHAALPCGVTLRFRATTNKNKTDSEHPWPGYFSLLDVLYARTGPTSRDRRINMVYELPVPLYTWLARLPTEPAAMRIVDALADVIVLRDATIRGGALAAGKPSEVISSRGLRSLP